MAAKIQLLPAHGNAIIFTHLSHMFVKFVGRKAFLFLIFCQDLFERHIHFRNRCENCSAAKHAANAVKIALRIGH